MSVTRIDLHDGGWIEVEETSPGVFDVVNDDFTVKNGDAIIEATDRGIMSWDSECKDIDNGQSDEAQCFGHSTEVHWNEVIMMPDGFRAPSIERLKEALKHISIAAWCPGDI
jgi:hypothetical protein